jgi:MoxR-like ATPase
VPPPPTPPIADEDYVEPPLPDIAAALAGAGMTIDERTLRRFHLSLKTRGFVVLSGISGTGKTWLAEEYANAVGARPLVVPVAPNWTTNEDLLGYLNPLTQQYHDTEFSSFLRDAATESASASTAGRQPRPYHLVLDEMNLARVEYYFAKFLSAMELRARSEDAFIELSPNDRVLLPPNLKFIGTVNVDETTHGFADKVYDRSQLLELSIDEDAVELHLGDSEFAPIVVEVWRAMREVAPFAFRVLDEITAYIAEAAREGVAWEEALDEQLLQKVLPKVRGTDLRVGGALREFVELSADRFPLSYEKATVMLRAFNEHGYTSYF